MGRTQPYAVNGSKIRERGVGAALTSDRGKNWYGEISIGTPPKTFTGSFSSHSLHMCTLIAMVVKSK
jgi:hypothetical protein